MFEMLGDRVCISQAMFTAFAEKEYVGHVSDRESALPFLIILGMGLGRCLHVLAQGLENR
jgi:hypothetical protein